MSTVQAAIEVSAPLHTVYEQLATFESYSQFMTGVEQVTQVSSDRTHWIMDLDGQRQEFDAQITECSLDERVSWATMEGPLLAETITLRPVGETRTQVVAQLEADVAFLMPSGQHGQESLNRRLKADLASFKRLVEDDAAVASDQLAGGAAAGAAGVSAGLASARPAGFTRTATGSGSKIMTPGTAFGSGSSMIPDPASPAAVVARANRNRRASGLGGSAGVSDRDAAGSSEAAGSSGAFGSSGMADLPAPLGRTPRPAAKPRAGAGDPTHPGDHLPSGTRMGSAGMGGQAMSAKDAWGQAEISEEERGSAQDL